MTEEKKEALAAIEARKELICNGCDSTGWLFQQESYSLEKREYVLIRIPFSSAEKEEVLVRYTVYNDENG